MLTQPATVRIRRRALLGLLALPLLPRPLYELRRLELPGAVAFRVSSGGPVTVLVPPRYSPFRAHLAALRLVFGGDWQPLCADLSVQRAA